ncbi:MAG: hypothetical protein L3J87_03085 [Thermoplasmata archaeon]|nr:hypothetical protein [Thermoplasmata archaeon]MCI4344593.1 hypothetical protein [Thermoplasmata archaeon]
MSGSPSPVERVGRLAPVVLAALLGFVAFLLFLGIYLAVPFVNHFYALVTIGVLALLFAIISYFTQALSADASLQRAFSWGFAAMGFALLFLAILLPLNTGITFLGQLAALIVLMLLVIVWVVGISWGVRARGMMRQRTAQRESWASHPPPSAFSYGSSNAPAPTPPAGATNPTPPGAR